METPSSGHPTSEPAQTDKQHADLTMPDDHVVDWEAHRRDFLAAISNVNTRERIASLGVGPFVLPSIFPKTSGWGARKDVKRRVRSLVAVRGRLDHLLYPGEQIEFVTQGLLSSWVEQWFFGLAAHFINRTLFLFTNYRVLLMHADGKYRPRHMQWQIPYDQITKFKPSGLISSSVTFTLATKRRLVFSNVPSGDRKRLKHYVQSQVDHVHREQFAFPQYRGHDPLCPNCSTPVPPRATVCAECDEAFINPMKPALMSLLIPCLGDAYLGHYGIALLELIGYAFSWFVFVGVLLNDGMKGLPFVLIFVVIIHLFDALVTYHVASKGAILQRAAWRTQ